MEIDEKIAEGYVILCHNKAEEHVFIVRTLGPAVECPKCGSTALSGDLATDYVRRKRHLANGARQVAVT
ncbi:MAG: hypothetical protein R3322_10095 [Kiloniellales bacterium]|nr:hypothetical protein [Kiloniellales bacterium]